MDGASSPPTAALAGSGLPGARALLSVSGRRLLGAQPGSAGSEVQGVAAWWVCSLMLSAHTLLTFICSGSLPGFTRTVFFITLYRFLI